MVQSGPNDVLLVAPGGHFARSDGAGWTFEESPRAGAWWTAAYALSKNDVWLGGRDDSHTLFAHHDGRGWTVHEMELQVDVTSLWAANRSDVWAATRGGLMHFDGTSWQRVYGFASQGDFFGITGTRWFDVFAVGYGYTTSGPLVLHYDGNYWFPLSFPPGLHHSARGAFSCSPNLTWIYGEDFLARANGTSVQLTQAIGDVESMWGASCTDLWAVTREGPNGRLQHFDGTTWQSVRVEARSSDLGFRLTGTSASDIWLTGSGTGASWALHFDGQAWSPAGPETWNASPVQRVVVDGPRVFALWGPTVWTGADGGWSRAELETSVVNVIPDADGFWLAGDRALLRHDALGFHVVTTPFPGAHWNTVWSAAPDDVWVAGFDTDDTPLLIRGREGSFRRETWTRGGIASLFGSSAEDAWAIAYMPDDQAHVLHFERNGVLGQPSYWTVMPNAFGAVSGLSFPTGETFIAGPGLLRRVSGDRWTQIVPRAGSLVGGDDPRHLWTAGESGLWRVDGTESLQISTQPIQDVAACEGEPAWFVSRGVLWQRRDAPRLPAVR